MSHWYKTKQNQLQHKSWHGFFTKAAKSTQVVLYFCSHFLSVDKLVSPKDLDPIGRYVAPPDQRNVSMRFSNQVSTSLVLQYFYWKIVIYVLYMIL